MSERYKSVSKSAHVNIPKLTIDKRDVNEVFNGRLKEDSARKVNAGTYIEHVLLRQMLQKHLLQYFH